MISGPVKFIISLWLLGAIVTLCETQTDASGHTPIVKVTAAVWHKYKN